MNADNLLTLNRRECLWTATIPFLTGWGLTQQSQTVLGQQADDLEPLNRFPRVVQEYYVTQVRAAEAEGNKLRDSLKTKADAEAYVLKVREKIAKSFGPFPEKTPLNPRITGTLDRDKYTVEKVIFESRPGFPVTGNLYLPKGGPEKKPGIIGTCGHSANGKAAEAYQAFAQGLARQGYVVLIFDPLGQGERLQYGHLAKMGGPRVGVGEHLYACNQQFLVGEFLGTWRAWDGIRALDYLLTRPEVDPNQVGVTGNSGGGTMTTWLCGVEHRWHMAAPACFVTTFRRNMENELPADTEQCPPLALAQGLDHSDFLAALAPKPIVILAKERDYFDVRGSQEAYERLKKLYTLLGKPDDISLFIGPTNHGYSQENREAMYRWFNRVTAVSDAMKEPALQIEKDEDLYCTKSGQISEEKPKTVYSFTKAKSEKLAGSRKLLVGQALADAVAETLQLPKERGPAPYYRILRVVGGRKYPKSSFTSYAIETEPNCMAVAYRLDDRRHDSRPPVSGGPALLYVSHQSADRELRTDPMLRDLIEKNPKATFYACDVRGVGETKPNTCGGSQTFLTPYGNDYFYAIHALMLGKPYLGRKTLDVLRVIDWLGDHGHKEVHLIGTGWGALPATFAALFADSVKKVTLKHALTSYQSIAESEMYAWPLSTLLPNPLAKWDLPDCYKELADKKLEQIEPWGPLAKPAG